MKKIVIIFLLFLALSTSFKVSAQQIKADAELDSSLFTQEDNMNNQKIETDSNFEIQGQITSVNQNSFSLLGELIVVSQDTQFQQNENINVGDFVKVDGVIKNGIKIADKVTILKPGVSQKTDVETTTNDDGLIKKAINAVSNFFKDL